MPKILIVDDDPQIRDILRIAMDRAAFETVAAANGAEALRLADQAAPDLVVLDVGLPEIDGLEVCRRLRVRSQVPILFLTARDDEIDRVLGFEMGCDDYVTKPFSPRELIARVRAILRRGRLDGDTSLTRGLLQLNAEAHDCRYDGVGVQLTSTELTLLAHLMARPQQVASRAGLWELIYGGNPNASMRTVDTHLANLRRKLAEAGCVDALQTVHGVGVRLGRCQGG